MRNVFVILLLSSIHYLLFADWKITRGPNIGEIYFMGPTFYSFDSGLYHSTDFGETITCVDSSEYWIGSVVADLTSGVIYRERLAHLDISYDYGQTGTWEIAQINGVSMTLSSGVTEGWVYNSITKHSANYGIDFMDHEYQGYIFPVVNSEIDCQQGIGYAISTDSSNDSLFVTVSYDNFDNLQLQSGLNLSGGQCFISRGYNSGELYLFCPYGYPVNSNSQDLIFSNDFGVTWNIINNFNFNTAITPEDWGIVGGRQLGELYVYATYYFDMGASAQIYIYHSLDFGKTFTKHHPWGFGTEPLVPHFNCVPDSGNAPLEVQFVDNSIGDVTSWEWDIDDDGTTDYFEQNPFHTYADTGLYSVKLTITGEEGSYSIVRDNSVYVTNEVNSNEESNQYSVDNIQLSNYPNPFNPSTTISFSLTTEHTESTEIQIYNVKGQKVEQISVVRGKTSVSWNADEFSSGIYFYKLNVVDSPIKKMVLIK
jgi:PKD repeat protein